MESKLMEIECNICNDSKKSRSMPCCKDKYICTTCLSKLNKEKCPYCQKEINIKSHKIRLSNIPNINYTQCIKVFSIILYVLTTAICIFLMGYAIEQGISEMSIFAIDLALFSISNICHIGIWRVVVTNPNGEEIIMADYFGYKYYLGGVFQNIIYIFFFFYFNIHFFLNSMTFIMICYNFVLYPLYNTSMCMYDQCSKILSFQEEIIIDDVIYDDSNTEPSISEYRTINIDAEPSVSEFRTINIDVVEPPISDYRTINID